jgi:hypothetical protein
VNADEYKANGVRLLIERDNAQYDKWERERKAAQHAKRAARKVRTVSHRSRGNDRSGTR